MVSRLSLMFWRWVVVLHDRLHAARDKAFSEALHQKYGVWRGDDATGTTPAPNITFTLPPNDNVSYTSPSVHYQGVNRREDD